MKEWGRRRRRRKVRPGDGRALDPMRWWQVLHRTVFHLELPQRATDEEAGQVTRPVAFQVEVNHLSEDFSASLYRERRQVGVGTSPAAFEVPGGVVEFASNLYGLRRMHYVPHDGGPPQMLEPDRRSLEGLRARFGERHPRASRIIGWVAAATLVVALVVGGLQLAETVSRWDVVPEAWGVFISPVSLPAWANGVLGAAALGSAVERALTLRHHWLLDSDIGGFE